MKSTLNSRYAVSVALVLATIAMAWSYWTVFGDMAEEWSKNELYSHGYIVPIFAVALLWFRRSLMPTAPLQPSWWALVFLLIAGVMRLGAAYYYYAWPDRDVPAIHDFRRGPGDGGVGGSSLGLAFRFLSRVYDSISRFCRNRLDAAAPARGDVVQHERLDKCSVYLPMPTATSLCSARPKWALSKPAAA